MSDAVLPLGLTRIRDARAVLAGRLPPSPCLPVDDGQARPGRLFVKAENLMPTGSFKIRGATYRISLLTAAERSRGVVAYSTGNHAQAVAKAARDTGVAATIVMSPDVPALKVAATERWGAEVVMAEPSSHARRALAERIAGESGRVLVPPYDDYAIMAGQGTIGLELLDQMPSDRPMTLFVPVGGGGLLAGVAAALKQASRHVRVIGVEPELENDACQSFKAGRIIGLAGPSESIADAIKVQQLGNLVFPLVQTFVDDIETVSEAEIAQATTHAWSSLKLIVEPGGAVGLAAALRAAKHRADNTVALLCGGNVTMERLLQIQTLC
jgi:threonine dehydratase